MDGDDVRVVERSHGERLACEPLAALRIRGGDIGQDLQRDLALEPRITRPIDLAHSADAKQRHDFVRTKPGARAKRHGARFCHEARADVDELRSAGPEQGRASRRRPRPSWSILASRLACSNRRG